MAGPAPAPLRDRRRHHRRRSRRRLSLDPRRGVQPLRPRRPPQPLTRTPTGEAPTAMFQWYVINTYSGHENKVKANLEHRIVSMNQEPASAGSSSRPSRSSRPRTARRCRRRSASCPGYVLVNMDMTDESWTVVKGTPGVTGFVGSGSKPVPLSKPEVDRILHTATAGAERPARDRTVRARRVGQGNLGAALGLRRRDRRRQLRTSRSSRCSSTSSSARFRSSSRSTR